MGNNKNQKKKIIKKTENEENLCKGNPASKPDKKGNQKTRGNGNKENEEEKPLLGSFCFQGQT